MPTSLAIDNRQTFAETMCWYYLHMAEVEVNKQVMDFEAYDRHKEHYYYWKDIFDKEQ